MREFIVKNKTAFATVLSAVVCLLLLSLLPFGSTSLPVLPKADTNIPNGSLTTSDTPPVLFTSDTPILGEGLGANGYVDIPSGSGVRWNAAQAVAFAIWSSKHHWENVDHLCDHAVSTDWGLGGSGWVSASTNYFGLPSAYRHHTPSDHTKIPLGASVYWPVGTFGHIAIIVGYRNGDALIASNDVLRQGYIDIVPLNFVRDNWGMGNPAAWSPPYFPNGFGKNPNPAPNVVTPANVPPPPSPGTKVFYKLPARHRLRWVAVTKKTTVALLCSYARNKEKSVMNQPCNRLRWIAKGKVVRVK